MPGAKVLGWSVEQLRYLGEALVERDAFSQLVKSFTRRLALLSGRPDLGEIPALGGDPLRCEDETVAADDHVEIVVEHGIQGFEPTVRIDGSGVEGGAQISDTRSFY